MKKTLLILLVIATFAALHPTATLAQSVAINADSSLPDASAILDLKSAKKGLLVPRMTTAQRDAIAAPATGLLIYMTDNIAGFYYYTGTAWTPLKSSGGSNGTGDNWSANSGDDIFNSNTGNVGVGTAQPTAKLEVKTPTTAYGFLHLGVTDSVGTDSVLLGDHFTAGVPGHGANHGPYPCDGIFWHHHPNRVAAAFRYGQLAESNPGRQRRAWRQSWISQLFRLQTNHKISCRCQGGYGI